MEVSLAAVLTGLGALAAGVGSVVSAIVGQHKATDEATRKCHEDLIAMRAEAERFSAELYAVRMAQREGL